MDTCLEIGEVIGERFQVHGFLGSGWEGEVYLVKEITTGIDRTAKIFFPERNRRNQAAISHARKLHRIRVSNSLVQYLFQDHLFVKDQKLTCLIYEYIQGEVLDVYLSRQKFKKLPIFEALHIVHCIARGLAPLHRMGEYHGDLHSSNIMIRRKGINFDIKMLDPFDWKDNKTLNIRKDVTDLIRILYDLCGGQRYYSSLPPEIKGICCGFKHSLILKKFPNADKLLLSLDNFEWSH